MKFDSRLMTNTLLSWILGFLLFHFDRELFWYAVGIFAFTQFVNWASGIPERRAKAKQEKADDTEYFTVYQPAFEAIRKKYDPREEWNEATSVPQEYRDEIRALNVKHRWMLKRRNNFDFD